MDLALTAVPAAALVTLTGVLLQLSRNWRLSIVLLGFQYIGVMLLTAVEWPLSMAVTRLVAGWIAGAVLGMALLGLPEPVDENLDIETGSTPEQMRRRGYRRQRLITGDDPRPAFHLLLAGLVCLAVVSQIPQVLSWLPTLGPAQAFAGLVLAGLGLMKLGIHTQPLNITLGLLTFFSGFEILYAAVESAPLTAALSAAITLGISLAGAYLLLAPHMEPTE